MLIITVKELTYKKKKPIEWALLALILINFIAYLNMNMKLTYGCSMDVRYVVLAAFGHFLLYGIELNDTFDKNKKSICYSFALTLATFVFNFICIFF